MVDFRMLSKRARVLFGICAVVGIAVFLKYGGGTGVKTTNPPLADQSLLPGSELSPREVQERAASSGPKQATQSSTSHQADTTDAATNAVYLESIGVVERLQKSRHNFAYSNVPGVPERATFRFTLDRQPLVELASRQETVAWPVSDGGVEFVTLHTVREQDGNLFIGGDVVGQGQFAMVMTADNSMSGQLLSPRGMYSYNSQLDEIVGQRVEGPIPID